MRSPRPNRRVPLQGFPPSVRLVGIGWYFAVCVVIGVGGGVLLDKELGSRPVLTLVGLALGLVFAFYGGFVQLKQVLDDVGNRRKGGQ